MAQALVEEPYWQEDEVTEVALLRRPSRQDSHSPSTTTISTTSTTTDVDSSSTANGALDSSFNQHQTGKPDSHILVDNDKDTGTGSMDGFSQVKDAIVDIAISKTLVLPVASSLPPAKMLSQDQIMPISSTDQGTVQHADINLLKDPTEIYLERLFEKPAAHEFYCPNCNSCIKKVLIRGTASEGAPPRPEPVDTFRCTSCFSFLIPIGKWFVPKLVPKDEDEQNEEENNTLQVPPADSSTNKAQSGATPLDPNNSPSRGTIHGGDTNASVINKDLSQAEAGERVNLITGTNGHPEADSNNLAHSKQDPAQLEVVIVGGRKEEKRKGAHGFIIGPVPAPLIVIDEKLIGGSKKSEKEKDTHGFIIGPVPAPLIVIDGKLSDESKKSDTGPEAEPPHSRPTVADLTERRDSEPIGAEKLEILKSIVYGGLIESITSLGVVTSAASGGADTMNIIALSLANLIGGVFLICHNLWDLKVEQPRRSSSQTNEQVDRYRELLGRRQNFAFHAIVAVLSFLVFGLVPPVVYGFTFMKSDDRVFKLAVVAAASLLCITILAIGKAYIQKPPKHYIKSVVYYIVTGITVSGISYVAGELVRRLIEQLGWFKSGEDVVLMPRTEMSSPGLSWASY